jgi:hypothetical protein
MVKSIRSRCVSPDALSIPGAALAPVYFEMLRWL